MPVSHRRAMRDILLCRTPALGGEVYLCTPCDEFRYSYHSCKNRHCPKCGNDQASCWLQKQFDRLLPLTHFLVTFTLPEELRKLARSNQRILYRILMRQAAEAVQKLARDPKWIGGTVGIVSVLQTWTRNLHYHPHLHMIVTGGGLSQDQRKFRRSPPDFLFPKAALMKIFRAKFRDQLKAELPSAKLPSNLWSKRWVLDITPVDSGHAAFRYLAPYIFRIALSNKRMVSLQNGQVTFSYQDGKNKERCYETLPAEQFIARFLQHVLPSRFRKVRYFGLFSPQRKKLLQTARLLLPPVPVTAVKSTMPKPEASVNVCPKCRQPMTLLQRIQRVKAPDFADAGIRAP